MIRATRIRALRKELGVGLREAAWAIGVSPSTLSRVERGLIDVETRVAVNMATYYKVPLDTLLHIPARPGDEKPEGKTRAAELRAYAEQLSVVVNVLLDIVAGLSEGD